MKIEEAKGNLETFINDLWKSAKTGKYLDCNGFIDSKVPKSIETLINEYENQQKEIKELHKEINEMIKLKIENEHLVDTEFIYKDKIREKIEELKDRSGGNLFHIQQQINSNIRILQELLEED